MKRHLRAILAIAAIFFLAVILFLTGLMVFNPPRRQQPREESFSEFLDQVNRHSVSSVKIFNRDQTVEGVLKNKQKFKTAFPPNYDVLKLVEEKVGIVEVDPQSTSTTSIIIQVLPLLLVPVLIALAILLAVWLVLRSRSRHREYDSEFTLTDEHEKKYRHALGILEIILACLLLFGVLVSVLNHSRYLFIFLVNLPFSLALLACGVGVLSSRRPTWPIRLNWILGSIYIALGIINFIRYAFLRYPHYVRADITLGIIIGALIVLVIDSSLGFVILFLTSRINRIMSARANGHGLEDAQGTDPALSRF